MAQEGGQLISASLTATPVFDGGAAEAAAVIADYRQQLRPIVEEGVDFIICEVGRPKQAMVDKQTAHIRGRWVGFGSGM